MSNFKTIPQDFEITGYIEVAEEKATCWSNYHYKVDVLGEGNYPAYVIENGRPTHRYSTRADAEAALQQYIMNLKGNN